MYYKIIPFEKTYYVCIPKPSNIKFEKEAILINFSDKVPFEPKDVFYVQTKEYLYCWFVREELKGRFLIPEGFLLYKELKKSSGDENCIGVYIKNLMVVFTVLKEGVLISQFEASRDEMYDYISLLKKEYRIDNTVFQRANFDFKLIVSSYIFLLQRIDFGSFFYGFIYDILLFLSVFLIGLSLTSFMLNKYLSKKLFEKKNKLVVLKKQNSELKREFYRLEALHDLWKEIFQKEFGFYGAFKSLKFFFSSVAECKGRVSSVAYSENVIESWIKIPLEECSIVDKLMSHEIYNKVQILTNRKQKEFNVLQIRALIKRKDNEK